MFLGSWRISGTGCRPVNRLGWQLKQAGLCQKAELLVLMQQAVRSFQRVHKYFKQT